MSKTDQNRFPILIEVFYLTLHKGGEDLLSHILIITNKNFINYY